MEKEVECHRSSRHSVTLDLVDVKYGGIEFHVSIEVSNADKTMIV